MPIYEYHCPRCKATYELRQGFDAETTQTCEECHKGIAKRVLYAPPVVFKGSGWYITDSKGKSSAISDNRGDSDSSGDSSTSDTSDSKPTKKSESKGSSSSAAPDAAAS